MMKDLTLHLVSYASGIAGVDQKTGLGPAMIQQSAGLKKLSQTVNLQWEPPVSPSLPLKTDKLSEVTRLCREIATQVSNLVRARKKVCVLGGDHSSAIGTWSGVYDALHAEGDIGLIWIDAHMDSNTPETSPSQNIHGMPLASLLGNGHPALSQILQAQPKLKPENICLIGIRSYEAGEAHLLNSLNVKIYDIDEVKSRGFDVVMQEALEKVSANTIAYGMSIDLDAFDPDEAPAVDVPEPNGIEFATVTNALSQAFANPKCVATEMVEFNPTKDRSHKTENILIALLTLIATAGHASC